MDENGNQISEMFEFAERKNEEFAMETEEIPVMGLKEENAAQHVMFCQRTFEDDLKAKNVSSETLRVAKRKNLHPWAQETESYKEIGHAKRPKVENPSQRSLLKQNFGNVQF